MQAVSQQAMPIGSTLPSNLNNSNTQSALGFISEEILDYIDTHHERLPLLIILYIFTIIWILYLILYHSRVQGKILSYLLRRFYFKDTAQIHFDAFSISFISGSIMFKNLNYTTNNYTVFVKDGYLVFRYWAKAKKKLLIRLKIQLNYLDVQFSSPIRSNTVTEVDDTTRGSIAGIPSKVEETQSVNAVKTTEEGLFIKRLRSLIPAVEIKVDHGRISVGHRSLPYSLSIRFTSMTSHFTTETPSKYAPTIDPMTLIYSLTYRNLRVQLCPTKNFPEDSDREELPAIPSTKSSDKEIFQIFECAEGELDYEQDVPGKRIENENPDVAWAIRIKCNKETKIAYAPMVDRQRELLWQYFLPTIYEESPITPESLLGDTRIFKSVRFKLLLNCSTILDLYFKDKKEETQQLHLECPNTNSFIDATLPFSTNPDGFDTNLSINLSQVSARTSLSYKPLLQSESLHIKMHIHYPRIWNALQDWFVNINARKAQVYFVFEHKNFFQELINDFASKTPPHIYSFTPFIYHINLRGEFVEVLIPSNQGNWIDCSTNVNPQAVENTYTSLCAKSFVLNYALPFLEFCPQSTTMELSINITDVLARLVIPEKNRMFYIIEGLDAHKKFYTPRGIQSQFDLSNEFDRRDGCFECAEAKHINILVEILLYSCPPYDNERNDLLYGQYVRSLGNRQTFHPNKLEYDVFNLEIDVGPVNLLLHGLFLKKLWWIKENLFGWDQTYHDIREPDLIREKKIIVKDDPLIDMIDETKPIDPRYFRPLMVTLRVALHNITLHLLHHTDSEPSPIGFCERLCVEMTTDLNETRLQVFFLPVNVYVEDSVTRNKADQHLSAGSLQLSGLVIRGHAMLSHEGLPPERETLEYAWQMDIVLGKISARLTTIQLEKIVCFLKNFYLQMMEDDYALVRSPVNDKTKWIEKLKYDVLRFSLDSVDFNLIETGNAISAQIAPVRLCMCNLHTSSCNEGLTLKIGAIQIRQLLRLHPQSWLEAGSIQIPELRLNAKFDCHPPIPINLTEQIEFLRRHDQHTQRLHFLYSSKSQSNTSTTSKRPSIVGLPINSIMSSCACLGGSPNYYTLVSGEQFFKSTYRLSEQPSFGRSLFKPDVHVIYSHSIFEQKYQWDAYEQINNDVNEQLPDEEIFYPFDFCTQQKTPDENATTFAFSRSSSMKNIKRKSLTEQKLHKRSSSSIPLNKDNLEASSSVISDKFLTPSQLSLASAQSGDITQSIPAHLNYLTRLSDGNESLSNKSSHSSSTDSLSALEEILQRQHTGHLTNSLPIKNATSSSIPQTSLPSSSWISLRNQMKMPIPKSTLLCTTYIRYLSHYRSTSWSIKSSFPPLIQQDQLNHQPLLDFQCVSQGFSCSFLSETLSSTHSRHQFTTSNPNRPRLSIIPALSSTANATEKEISLRFLGSLNILFTPLMLECLTTYIDKWQTFLQHPLAILDGLHFQIQTSTNLPSSSTIDLSATKFSFQLPKINLSLLQAGLAEDNVQLTELRTPVDIVTMSLFALSCKQIQMETILSKRDQSTAMVFKIQSITGQFRRFENEFSSLENVNIHAIQSQRCRLQFHIANDIQTHLPIDEQRKNFGFVMNEFGLHRLCFRLINNAAKQEKERQQPKVNLAQIDETQTTKSTGKQKAKRKQSTDPTISPPTTTTTTTTVAISPTAPSPSSSVFDGSIDHVWISFPEPPHQTQSTSNVSKRPRSSTTSVSQLSHPQKKLFSYTRYDWNFLSTLSPTVLGWFCVLNRIQQPMKTCMNKREKYLDAVLTYFLIEMKTNLTLSESKFYELFTPKTKYLLAHPVCQLITEMRKTFNRNSQIKLNLQEHFLPDIQLLKQGIRHSCRLWAKLLKQQPTRLVIQPIASANTNSPINSILPTNPNDQEQVITATRVRTRLAKDTIIDMSKESSAGPERRRTSNIFVQPAGYENLAFEQDKALRHLEPTANVNNTVGYRRINNIGSDESDFEVTFNPKRHTTQETGYIIDPGSELTGSVEQLFRVLLEYAGVELSVTSSIEPLFKKLGQTVLASAHIKKFDVKILPNELINNNNSLPLSINPSLELSVLNVTNLNLQSVFRQSLEHDQLHSANVQGGVRIQRIRQEVNLSLLRLVYQFYTVFGNAVEYTGINEVIQTDGNFSAQTLDSPEFRSRTSTLRDRPESGIENLVLKTLQSNILQAHRADEFDDIERPCWKKLRELIVNIQLTPEVKTPQPNDTISPVQQATTDTLLLSAFGWLIIDEIYYAASLGGLKVEGYMRKVQGSMSLAQKLRAMKANTSQQTSKKYDGSLILQIESTTLSLKETHSTNSDTLINSTQTKSHDYSSATSQDVSVLDIIIGKSRALTSLQTRGVNLTLSAVTNIGTIAMDVPLRPQEVHALVNRAGRLITSYVQEFLPDEPQESIIATSTPAAAAASVQEEFDPMDTSLNDTIEEVIPLTTSEQIPEKKRSSHIRRKPTLTSNPTSEILETQQSISSAVKGPLFQVHLTAQCQGMTFSTTLLSTLKAQYKIGIVEGVAHLGSAKSRFTAVVHEHALHFLTNKNSVDLPTVSSDNHVRIDFPEIRCYGNYTTEQDEYNQTRGHLNLRSNIEILKLTITADFLAQLVFVSQVIIDEINEILAKVSGVDQFEFQPAKSALKIEHFNDDDEDKPPSTLFSYKIGVFMRGFEVIGQTPSNTVVKFENGEKKVPIRIKLTNLDEENSLLLHKPSINALLFIKLSLGQLLHTGGFQDDAYFKTRLLVKNSFQFDEPDKEAYFIQLIQPSFYWQPGAIDKGILFWLNYKNTYEHWNEQRGAFTTPKADGKRIRSLVNVQPSPAAKNQLNLMFQLHIIDLGIAVPLQQVDHPTKLSENVSMQPITARQSLPLADECNDFLVFTLDQTTISACSCGAIISSGSFEGFCFRFAEGFQHINPSWKPTRSSTSSSNVILNACCVPSGQYLMHSRAKHLPNSTSPKWFLNVQWDMKGIDIHIDSIIGKRFSQLIRTITSTHLIAAHDQLNTDNDSLNNSNFSQQMSSDANNLNESNDPSEDDERRKRLEYEYSILGQKIAALKRSNASADVLKPEEVRYNWLEKELLHTVKTEIQQKMKKQSNKANLNRPILPSLSVPHHQRSNSQDQPVVIRNTRSYMKNNSFAGDQRRSAITTPQTPFPPSPIREEDTDDLLSLTNRRVGSNEAEERQSNTSMNPTEITSTPAVDLELNLNIQIATGSCNLYTRRDLIAHPPSATNLSKQQTQTMAGVIDIINKIEYHISQFSLPGVDVYAHYHSKHDSTTTSSLNKKGSVYCQARVRSPSTQLIIHPILLDFLEQTLEYVKLPSEQPRRTSIKVEPIKDPNVDDDHLNSMFLPEDGSSSASFPIDVVVSLSIQPCVLLFTCLPTHPMECELRLPAVDVVLSSKRSPMTEIPSEQIVENSFVGLSFSLYMKDFKLNVYHPFSGESKVHLYEDFRAGQLQTRNALAVSVQSVSVNISRTRYILITDNGEYLNNIQLSTLAQISKAQFEFDIRRFSEILTFPKIWYNRTLARRLFLGDETLPTRISSSNTIARPHPTVSSTTTKQIRKQARVLVAVQLSELHISMRMSNVMGIVEWNTKDVNATGRLKLTSEGKKILYFLLGLRKSVLQAEQGIIGGLIKLKNLRTTGSIHQELRDRSDLIDASHIFDVLASGIEVRLDYMGSPTLMGRISDILLRLKDDRHSTRTNDSIRAMTLVLVNLEWSQLHLMITRSTTPDIMKMVMKLIEFFTAHLTSSKHLLASVQYDFRTGTKRTSPEKTNVQQPKYDINIIKRHIGMNGGEIMLQGHNLTVVVFHGLNFKSRQWALFSLNEPQINFVTDRDEEGDINQKLFFYLGHQSQTTQASLQSRTNMASISKVTRNSNDAPSSLTTNEWFDYASSSISAVGLRDFPNFDDDEPSTVTRRIRPKQYEQNAEPIFILPGLELRFQTRQLNGQVHCSFETEFYEHIMFSFNAEHFYFLHDLISCYIKEKEKAITDKVRSRFSNDSTTTTNEELKGDDTRKFICPDNKWKLQPTIRLLTAYGNEVEPFGADYVLQKLGFRHARLTIPKWVQRGIMDPCEQSMTFVQLLLIFLLPERFKESCLKV